jgi:hypothetical protein
MAHQKPATRNQQLETSNQQPATRNQQPATSNQQPETSNQKPATRNQQPETSNQKTTPKQSKFVFGSLRQRPEALLLFRQPDALPDFIPLAVLLT